MVKQAGRVLPLLLILFFESGCTYALWTNGNLEDYKEPTQNPDLHLYESQKRKDFLVVYQEISERNDAIHSRAYWLNKNETRVDKQHAPIYASKKSVDHLPAVPVYYSMPEKSGQGFYAVCETNAESFTLFSSEREMGTYRLPVYNDGWGRVEKTALTPFAVTADLSVVAGFLAYEWAQSGITIPVK